MWVYWVTLGLLCITLYFPYKKYISPKAALLSSSATFVLGLVYPLLQTELSVWQIVVIVGLLLAFLGLTMAKSHPTWPTSANIVEEIPEEKEYEISAAGQAEDVKSVELIAEKEDILIENVDQAIDSIEPVVDQFDEPETVAEQSLLVAETSSTIVTNEATVSAKEQVVAVSQTVTVDIIEESEAEPTAEVFTVITEKPEILEEMPQELSKTEPEENTLEIFTKVPENVLEDMPEKVYEVISEEVKVAEKLIEVIPSEICQELIQDVYDEEVTEPVTTELIEQEIEPQVAINTLLENQESSPHSLLVEGIRFAKQSDYTRAVRCINQVIAAKPEAELLYLAISELSSIYQHLGLYPMASAIIKAFGEHPDLQSHPGMASLKQKLRFIIALTDLLDRYHYGQIPYDQVPEAVRREAFDQVI